MSAPINGVPPPGGDDDWRGSIAQSFRSGEVRSIAKVLASLEPSATSASKTMLAMRFEESIFKAASSLDNYRSTIQKRLKKLQKHYAKQQAAGGARDGGSGGVGREKELVLESELRDEYGARLLYIAEHADGAVELTREKHDDRKAEVLAQHAGNAKQWAVHLGLELPPGCSGRENFKRQEEEKRDIPFLLKLKSYLESRVENIRSHVVKIKDPDLFLEEALVKIEDTALKQRVTDVYRRALEAADPDSPRFTREDMEVLLDRMNAPVPIPRRHRDGDPVRAAVARVEKVRAAAQALYTFMGLPLADKTHFRGCMEKCHAVAMECLNDLEGEYDALVKDLDDTDEQGKRIITLEDAWNTPMQFEETEGGDETNAKEPPAKRQKSGNVSQRIPMVIRSRILLTQGRKTFSTLLPALKRKRATLVRNGPTTFVRMEFGKAFEMTIYFVPLLVTIRAMPTETIEDRTSTPSLMGGHRWPSLYQGLYPPDNRPAEASLQLLGVTGSYETLGHAVAKKLEYASARATHALRRCFAETTSGKCALAKSEFEIEILEAGALIRFLQMARSTYVPDWEDDDA